MKKEKSRNLQAIRGSIRHWILDVQRQLKTDIIKKVSDDLEWINSGEEVACHGVDCDLCLLVEEDSHCKNCPLHQLGVECVLLTSPYNRFYDHPTYQTATDMVCALVCAYWNEMEKQNA